MMECKYYTLIRTDSVTVCCFFLMIRRPPRSTRTDTLFPTRRSSDLGDCARWYDRLAHELPLSYKVPAISGQGFGMRAKPSKPRPFRRLSTGTIFGSSAIHVAAMSDGCNEHQELAVFNFADDPKIAHAISPQSRTEESSEGQECIRACRSR